jgi:hypothetical protein
MNSYKKGGLVFLIFIILFSISILMYKMYVIQNTRIVENMNENKKIPKIIWTFWDGDLTDLITLCIDSWKRHNPNYEIIILNKENIHQYLPTFNSDLKHANDIRHYSDIVRIHILEKYGGIWSDASIICYDSYDWILDVQQENEVEFVGYWINDDLDDSPVIENWFFAATPKSEIITDWKNELMKSQEYNSKDDYINYLLDNCNAEKIDNPPYLWMHVAMQKILQENKNKYKYKLFPAREGPFKYLEDNEWKNNDGINDLVNCSRGNTCKQKYGSVVKFTGYQREDLEKIDFKQLFD